MLAAILHLGAGKRELENRKEELETGK